MHRTNVLMNGELLKSLGLVELTFDQRRVEINLLLAKNFSVFKGAAEKVTFLAARRKNEKRVDYKETGGSSVTSSTGQTFDFLCFLPLQYMPKPLP